MTFDEFQSSLLENLDLPFEISEVSEIESNCGSTWINLQNDRSFFISVEQCETEEENT